METKEEQKAKIAALEQAHALRDYGHTYQLQTEGRFWEMYVSHLRHNTPSPNGRQEGRNEYH